MVGRRTTQGGRGPGIFSRLCITALHTPASGVCLVKLIVFSAMNNRIFVPIPSLLCIGNHTFYHSFVVSSNESIIFVLMWSNMSFFSKVASAFVLCQNSLLGLQSTLSSQGVIMLSVNLGSPTHLELDCVQLSYPTTLFPYGLMGKKIFF